jgi:hypothetical protein
LSRAEEVVKEAGIYREVGRVEVEEVGEVAGIQVVRVKVKGKEAVVYRQFLCG